jgi:hypothetical protein
MTSGHVLDAARYITHLKGAFMGCDIHWYSETKKDGNWVCDQAASFAVEDEGDGYDNTDMDNFPNRDRDYWWFGFIQPGVRTEWDFGFSESSLPDDLSKEVQAMSDSYGSDGHSHGHLTRADLKAKLKEFEVRRTEELINPTDKNEAVTHFIQRLLTTIGDLNANVPDEDQRVVFWFDN